jgi:hypothetical protein
MGGLILRRHPPREEEVEERGKMAPPQPADEVVLPALQTQATVLLMRWPRLALLALLFSTVARILHDHHLQETLNPTHPPILSVCIDETFSLLKDNRVLAIIICHHL